MLTYFCGLLRDLFWYLYSITLFQLLWHVIAACRRRGSPDGGHFSSSCLLSQNIHRKTFLCHQISYLNMPAPEPPTANVLVEVRILSPISYSCHDSFHPSVPWWQVLPSLALCCYLPDAKRRREPAALHSDREV